MDTSLEVMGWVVFTIGISGLISSLLWLLWVSIGTDTTPELQRWHVMLLALMVAGVACLVVSRVLEWR